MKAFVALWTKLFVTTTLLIEVGLLNMTPYPIAPLAEEILLFETVMDDSDVPAY